METTTKVKQKVSAPTGIIMIVWVVAAVLAISVFIISIVSGLFRLLG